MSDEGKKLGIVGGLFAAIAGVFASAGGSCARLGAKAGVVTAVEGVGAGKVGARAATEVGENAAKVGGRAAPRVPGAAPAGARGFPMIALGEGRGPTWSAIAEDLAREVGTNGLQAVLESCLPDGEGTSSAEPLASTQRGVPTLVAVVPVTMAGYRRAFDTVPSAAVPGIARVAAAFPDTAEGGAAPLVRSPLILDVPPASDLSARWSELGGSPIVFLAYSTTPGTLANGLLGRCLATSRSCLLLRCETADYAAARPCALRAKDLFDSVPPAGDLREYVARLALARDRAKVDVTIVRALLVDGHPRRFESRREAPVVTTQ